LAGNRVITACYTGDIGHFDEDGFVFITDRKKDVVFIKGFDVFPREVEEVIHTHPKVSMVGVVGVPMASASTRSPSSCPERAKWSIGYKCPSEVRVSGECPLRPLTSWTGSHCGGPQAAEAAGRLSSHGPIKKEW
jgi:acyl-CoA synthetase (AMP-forming)/AMP-acid ligase II